MNVEYRIISIGALSHHRLWGEGTSIRTAHATTTLVTDGERTILVDPSLPATAMAARFNERTGKTLDDVTDVFCTTLRPVHRRSIAALAHANWWTGELELASYCEALNTQLDSAGRLNEEDAQALKADLDLLKRFKPAPDKFGNQISFYPLRGPSVGGAGLLLTPATSTVVIAGDAALSSEHVMAAQVWQGCSDTEMAKESLGDLIELADIIIPGHDNLIFSPQRWL